MSVNVCMCVLAFMRCLSCVGSPPLHSLAVRSGLLADVLSEGGLLELLLGELRRRAKILRKAGVVSNTPAGQGYSYYLGLVAMNGLMV